MSAMENPAANALNPYAADELVLPGFVRQREDGVFVDLGALSSAEEFFRVVERIFSLGKVLRGLDYRRFHALLYNEGDFSGLLEIRLADAIDDFAAERQPLYRSPKIVGGEAEYLFEPLVLEKMVEVPIYTPGENGESVYAGSELQAVSEPATLDFDEFVAALWKTGVRYGLDAELVRKLIASGACERCVIARARTPTEGSDASIEEQTAALHRSDAPMRLADGRVDLACFANRFPQIHKGTLLLKKIPRALGQAGRDLSGRLLEPRLPEDFDLAKLAGEGTAIERYNEFEYLVAVIDGFLNIDNSTNQISITKKIINREGVSSRTTGSLNLEGDEYEEFGEVHESMSVTGQSLTFHADVFGKVMSRGGRILLESNLVGGLALNRNGDIEVRGLASSAFLNTAAGTVRIARAENSVIVAERIEIEWACQCVLLADQVEVLTAEACAIAGKQVHVTTLREHRSEENVVSMLLPDLSGFERQQGEEQQQIVECQEMIAKLRQGMAVLTGQAELQQYLAMAGKLQRREVVLNPQQQAQWQQFSARMKPTVTRLAQAREDIGLLEQEINELRQRIAALEGEKAQASEGIACQLDDIQGETVVRPLLVERGKPPLGSLHPKDLRARLRSRQAGEALLFSERSGSFSWVYALPEGAES